MISGTRGLAVPAVLCLVVATTGACAALGLGGRVDTFTLSGDPNGPAETDETLGRRPEGWTAEPTTPDTALLGAAKAGCNDSFSGDVDQQDLIRTGALLQDQRGPDGAAFLWTGGSTAYCFIGRTQAGNIRSPFGSWRQDVLRGALAIEGNEHGPPAMVTGAVDPTAAAVEIQTASGLLLRATTGDGRFVAWWPGADPLVAVRSLDTDGNVLATVRP